MLPSGTKYGSTEVLPEIDTFVLPYNYNVYTYFRTKYHLSTIMFTLLFFESTKVRGYVLPSSYIAT